MVRFHWNAARKFNLNRINAEECDAHHARTHSFVAVLACNGQNSIGTFFMNKFHITKPIRYTLAPFIFLLHKMHQSGKRRHKIVLFFLKEFTCALAFRLFSTIHFASDVASFEVHLLFVLILHVVSQFSTRIQRSYEPFSVFSFKFFGFIFHFIIVFAGKCSEFRHLHVFHCARTNYSTKGTLRTQCVHCALIYFITCMFQFQFQYTNSEMSMPCDVLSDSCHLQVTK